jgi:hypothetical protein
MLTPRHTAVYPEAANFSNHPGRFVQPLGELYHASQGYSIERREFLSQDDTPLAVAVSSLHDPPG